MAPVYALLRDTANQTRRRHDWYENVNFSDRFVHRSASAPAKGQ
jgi:hypothetical protein